MGNKVEVVFEVKENGVLKTGREIGEVYSRMSPEVEKAWREVEAASDRAGKAAAGGISGPSERPKII